VILINSCYFIYLTSLITNAYNLYNNNEQKIQYQIIYLGTLKTRSKSKTGYIDSNEIHGCGFVLCI